MRILLVIRSLEIGGAERQLALLAAGLRSLGLDVRVLCLYERGELRRELESSGVPVTDLGKRGRWDLGSVVTRYVRYLKEFKPRVVYGFMSSASVLAVLAKPVVPEVSAVFGVRASAVRLEHYDWMLRLLHGIERILWRWADHVISNSEAGRTLCLTAGLPPSKISCVWNGVDTDRFRFSPGARSTVRSAWGLHSDELLFGMLARVDPMKGYEIFLEAASLAIRELPGLRFVAIGHGSNEYLGRLKTKAHALGLDNHLIWAGSRTDVSAVLSALDVLVSASIFGEGFSNAVAEGMSCERVCIVTDVGDSARIVGDTASTIHPGDVVGLAKEMIREGRATPLSRALRGRATRQRIVTVASVSAMVDRTLNILSSLR